MLESSYYSTVRNSSGLDVFLIKSKILEQSELTFSGFDVIEGEESFSNFSFLARKMSNDLGEFNENVPPTITPIIKITPTITITGSNKLSMVVVFINPEYNVDELDLSCEGFELTKSVGVLIFKALNETTEFFCTFLNGSANKEIIIETVIASEQDDNVFVKVEKNDIESASFDYDGDITGGKLPKFTANLSLFDKNEIYCKDFNIMLIRHTYTNNDKSVYFSPKKVFFIPKDEIIKDTSSEDTKTKIKAYDIMSVMNDEYFSSFDITVSDLEELNLCVDYFNDLHKQNFEIKTETKTNVASFDGMRGQISSTPCNIALHSLSFLGSRLLFPKNDKIEYADREFKTDLNISELQQSKKISFKEFYQRPKIKKYEKLKKITLVLTNSFVDGKTVEDTAQAKIEGLLPTAALFEKGYDIVSIVSINIKGDAKDITNDFEFSFSANRVLLTPKVEYDTIKTIEIKAVLQKLGTQKNSISKSINAFGEDLTIESDVYGLTPGGTFYTQNYAYKPYEYTDEYTLDLRGRFDIDLYDVILLEIEKNRFIRAGVTKHKLSYNGAYKSELTVFDINKAMLSNLYPNNKLFPSESLYPTNDLREVE